MHVKGLQSLKAIILLSFFLALIPAAPVHAVTTIETDETWSGTVTIDQDVLIISGATLTIEPGTVVTIAPTDAGNVGIDTEHNEIIVENGAIIADGATFQTTSGLWYGIQINELGSAAINECEITNAIQGITIYTFNTVTITGNEIHDLHGTGGIPGIEAIGILVNKGNPLIQDNKLYDIWGGDGVDGAPGAAGSASSLGGTGEPGTKGGNAVGIRVINGSAVIQGNQIYQITGGTGGSGGDGGIGGIGAPGESGGYGGTGGIGSDGGHAYGIHIASGVSGAPQLIDNKISFVNGGLGGDAGSGGNGGNGGNGGTGISGDPAGVGGPGGNGGDGGFGGFLPGFGGLAYGMDINKENLMVTDNIIKNITGGTPGLPGEAGDGGAGGKGGTGGDFTGTNGNGGAGGAGGAGGNGAYVQDINGGAEAAGIKIAVGGFASFERNRIISISSGTPQTSSLVANGGDGGAGGRGGVGGAGKGTGNGGVGGDGGVGGHAGRGGNGPSNGRSYGLNGFSLRMGSGTFANNIFAHVETQINPPGSNGGNGGDGGWGGDGGMAGDSGLKGINGVGGNGGEAGSGGNGGAALDAYLFYCDRTSDTVILTNNTLYQATAPLNGGSGGSPGSPGYGGAGSAVGLPGSDGIIGDAGTGGSSYGFYYKGGTYQLFNNIFMGDGGANSVGIKYFDEGIAGTLTADYNNFYQWFTLYEYTSGGVNDMNLDPKFKDPAQLNFSLQSISPCIDAGDNTASGVPDVDIDGKSRPFDGDSDGTAVVDMGAYENHFINYLFPIFFN